MGNLKNRKRLQLNKETLRTLSQGDLKAAIGGDLIIRKVDTGSCTDDCTDGCPRSQMVDGCAIAC